MQLYFFIFQTLDPTVDPAWIITDQSQDVLQYAAKFPEEYKHAKEEDVNIAI